VSHTFVGGRLPAEPARPHLKFAVALTPELPAPPASDDWLTPVPADAWGVLGNDEVGDCTCAGVAHKRIGDVYLNQEHTVLGVTTAQTLALYSAVTGYNPADPSTDQGAVCQDVLDYWRKRGFLGERIIAFAKVDISNETELRQAIHLFGQVYAGFAFPSTAMDQFNAGETWDVVRGARNEGGHCVTLGAYDKNGLECVTWGKVQKLTWAFFRKYFDEAWVIISPDMIDPATGRDIQGLDLYALGQDFAALTGQKNPVPAPAPQPQPAPTPTPAPSPLPVPTPSPVDPRLVQAAGLAKQLDALMTAWEHDTHAA
jgi:hypothetical protein